jgi:GTP cyclohydrolase II
MLRPVAEARVPLEGAPDSRIVAFRSDYGDADQYAVVIGKLAGQRPVLCRVHSACFTGDLLGSLRCDCGPQLRAAIQAMAKEGTGVILYLAQEGRGVGLINKLRAYRLQDCGMDTVEANEQLGFEADERVYLAAATMLHHLGIERVRLMTDNPEKLGALAKYGIDVIERVLLEVPPSGHTRCCRASPARPAPAG